MAQQWCLFLGAIEHLSNWTELFNKKKFMLGNLNVSNHLWLKRSLNPRGENTAAIFLNQYTLLTLPYMLILIPTGKCNPHTESVDLSGEIEGARHAVG